MMLMLLFFALLGSVLSQTQVDTIYGTVEGLRDNHDGRDFDKFIGIPFAEPPVGDLRWRKPERPATWDDVYMATTDKAECIQLGSEEASEDCLYLSVYVPDGVENVQDLPVMVFIHGGGFLSGSHWSYHPDELIMHGDVIYVGINYRLASIGFLSTDDDVSPGNYGLWDQAAALQWVSENIQAFGGDPDRITAFGQSAGGSSVSHMLMSPHSNQFISGGIALSGASSANFGTMDGVNAVQGVKMLNHIFDCGVDDDDFEGIIDCLRLEDAETVGFWSIVGFLIYHQQAPPFIPIVDGDFVADDPRVLWANGAANDKDFITGHMHDDFANILLLSNGNYSEFAEDGGLASDSETLDFMLNFLLNGFGNSEELVEALYEEYPDMLSDDTLTRTVSASDCGTDATFGSTCHYEAIEHAANNGKSTWAYDMHYAQSFLQYPEWVAGTHGDDLYSVFGEVHRQDFREALGEYDNADHETKDYVMSYFTNFAWTGNPNQGPHDIDVVWDPYVEGNMMTIRNNPAMRPVNPAKADHYRWWLEEFPLMTEPNDFTDYVYEDGPLADCEPGFPIDTDCIEAILNITLPFPSERDVTQMTWDFERTLADGLSHVVDILSNTVELSDPERWDAFEAQMDRAIIKREESLLRKLKAAAYK